MTSNSFEYLGFWIDSGPHSVPALLQTPILVTFGSYFESISQLSNLFSIGISNIMNDYIEGSLLLLLLLLILLLLLLLILLLLPLPLLLPLLLLSRFLESLLSHFLQDAGPLMMLLLRSY